MSAIPSAGSGIEPEKREAAFKPAEERADGAGREFQALAALLRTAQSVTLLKLRIALTKAKIKFFRMALATGLLACSTILALLAVIFLYIGCFRLLTDVAQLSAVWAWLIFAGIHVVTAVVLFGLSLSILRNKSKST